MNDTAKHSTAAQCRVEYAADLERLLARARRQRSRALSRGAKRLAVWLARRARVVGRAPWPALPAIEQLIGRDRPSANRHTSRTAT